LSAVGPPAIIEKARKANKQRRGRGSATPGEQRRRRFKWQRSTVAECAFGLPGEAGKNLAHRTVVPAAHSPVDTVF
jgi:hypothetical protein